MDDQALRVLLKQLSDVITPIGAVGKVRLGRAKSLEDLENAVQRMPSAETLAQAVDDLRQKLESLIREERGLRREGFGVTEAEYINQVRTAESIRELDNGWRIGPIELALRRERGEGRVLYNHEEVIGWRPLSAAADFQALVSDAQQKLRKGAWEPALRERVFWHAYVAQRRQRTESRQSRPDRVPLPDFYGEVRVELTRAELGGKPDRRLQSTVFPLWAFLYNLDSYRASSHEVPEERRLGFETGSQSEQRQLGMTLNGLDANAEYRALCYVIAGGAQP